MTGIVDWNHLSAISNIHQTNPDVEKNVKKHQKVSAQYVTLCISLCCYLHKRFLNGNPANKCCPVWCLFCVTCGGLWCLAITAQVSLHKGDGCPVCPVYLKKDSLVNSRWQAFLVDNNVLHFKLLAWSYNAIIAVTDMLLLNCRLPW